MEAATYHSEEFNTAGRSIKTGLVAVDVVSHWTWVATLLQSTRQAYVDGISGSFWYATTSAVQIFLFGTVAIQLKRKAPKAHTVMELVRRRWGHTAGFVFLYLCNLNNIVISALLFLGGASALQATTGMNVYAALMLFPISVIVYTMVGGLKASFVSSYLHTVIVYVTLNVFVYKIYASSSEPIGSIGSMWENLVTYAGIMPIKHNRDGSYLTIFSRGGIEFAALNFLATFGNVWADQSFWQSAIAATPKAAAFRGYILGGLVWIPIPFALATAWGLSAVAFDLPLSQAEVDGGLIPVAVAQYLLGKGGVVLVLTMIFMAVTSTGSAQLMAMSSLFTYDVYKTYLNREASGKELLLVLRVAVVAFGLLLGGFSCFLFKAGFNVNFLFLVMGLLVLSAFPPLTFMLLWPAVPKGAAIAAALGGQICAIVAWIVHTQVVYDELDINGSLQMLGPTLDGTIVATVMSSLICIVWTLLFPDTTGSFSRFHGIEVMDDVKVIDYSKEDPATMNRLFKQTAIVSVCLCVLVVVVWPVLTLPAGVFSKGYFTFYVVLSIVWATVATIICIFLPLAESRKLILWVAKLVLGMKVHPDLTDSIEEASPDGKQLKSNMAATVVSDDKSSVTVQ